MILGFTYSSEFLLYYLLNVTNVWIIVILNFIRLLKASYRPTIANHFCWDKNLFPFPLIFQKSHVLAPWNFGKKNFHFLRLWVDILNPWFFLILIFFLLLPPPYLPLPLSPFLHLPSPSSPYPPHNSHIFLSRIFFFSKPSNIRGNPRNQSKFPIKSVSPFYLLEIFMQNYLKNILCSVSTTNNKKK